MRPTLRRLLPRRLHHVTGQAARWFIRSVEATAADGGDVGAFAPAAAPLFKPETFAAGPILHANTALAWGGAERQLVNILLRSLPQRLGCTVGLLCLRLGEKPGVRLFSTPSWRRPTHRRAMPWMWPPPLTQLEAPRAAPPWPRTLPRRSPGRRRTSLPMSFRFAGEFAVQRPRLVHGWQDGVGLAAGFAALAVGVPRIIVAGPQRAARRISS